MDNYFEKYELYEKIVGRNIVRYQRRIYGWFWKDLWNFYLLKMRLEINHVLILCAKYLFFSDKNDGNIPLRLEAMETE